MKSLYFKNFLVSAGMVLMSFLILGLVFVFLGRSALVSERKESLSTTAQAVAATAAAYLETDSYDVHGWDLEGETGAGLRNWDLRVLLSATANITGSHLFLCDAQGVVVNCSDNPGECSHMSQQVNGGVIALLKQNGALNGVTNLGGMYPGMYYVVALPIQPEGQTQSLGYVFVASEASGLVDAWSTFLYIFSLTAMVVLFVAIIMAFIGAKRLTEPLNEMANAARRFAHGDFSVRVQEEPEREDEVAELTVAFNAMAESLEKSEQLRSQFIANVSHELKTPMTTISGFADGILDGTIPKENQDKYLMTISSETKRLSRLVRRMLELSRIQDADSDQIKKRSFDITEVLCQTLLTFEKKITDKGLDVDALLPEEEMPVRGDADAITQVVYNLLDNAIKFSEPGGVLGVSLWKQSGKAFVAVKNQGRTIPPEQLPLVFDRFHKADSSRSQDRDGVGLGLYIVKSILNNHDEDIRVTSRDGVTEFVFSLTLSGKQS